LAGRTKVSRKDQGWEERPRLTGKAKRLAERARLAGRTKVGRKDQGREEDLKIFLSWDGGVGVRGRILNFENLKF